LLLYKPLGSEIAFSSVNIIKCSDRVSRGNQIVYTLVCLMVHVEQVPCGYGVQQTVLNVDVLISSRGWSYTWCFSSLWVWYRVMAVNCSAGHMMLLKASGLRLGAWHDYVR
jgi:hypothetical protein